MAFKVVSGKAVKKTTMTREDLFKMAEDYDTMSFSIKALTEQKKTLSDKIKELSIKLGTLDEKGSSYCQNEEYVCGNVAKHSISLNTDKAVNLLQKKGMNNLITEKIVKVVDEKKLEKAVAVGEITQEEFESIMDDKVSYSVVVKKAEEMPEVEVSNLKVAKSK